MFWCLALGDVEDSKLEPGASGLHLNPAPCVRYQHLELSHHGTTIIQITKSLNSNALQPWPAPSLDLPEDTHYGQGSNEPHDAEDQGEGAQKRLGSTDVGNHKLSAAQDDRQGSRANVGAADDR